MILITIETTTPGATYTLLETPGVLTVHIAGLTPTGGTGPILCGFDRFQRDDSGQLTIGFSVGGGTTGPGTHHRVCKPCAALAEERPISGTHRGLFKNVMRPLRDRQGDIWTLGDDGLMHSPETEPFSRDHVERKWGPLTLVDDAVSVEPTNMDQRTGGIAGPATTATPASTPDEDPNSGVEPTHRGTFGHVWPCPLFYVSNWRRIENGHHPLRDCTIPSATAPAPPRVARLFRRHPASLDRAAFPPSPRRASGASAALTSPGLIRRQSTTKGSTRTDASPISAESSKRTTTTRPVATGSRPAWPRRSRRISWRSSKPPVRVRRKRVSRRTCSSLRRRRR